MQNKLSKMNKGSTQTVTQTYIYIYIYIYIYKSMYKWIFVLQNFDENSSKAGWQQLS